MGVEAGIVRDFKNITGMNPTLVLKIATTCILASKLIIQGGGDQVAWQVGRHLRLKSWVLYEKATCSI